MSNENRYPTMEVRFEHDRNYFHVNASVSTYEVTDDEEAPNGSKAVLTWNTYSGDDAYDYARIAVDNQTDVERLRRDETVTTGDAMYGVYIKWRHQHGDLSEHERAIKALRKVENYLKKTNEIAGQATSFGQQVLRVCKALGIRKMWIRRPGEDSNPLRDLDWSARIIDEEIGGWMREARATTANVA